MPDLTAPLLSLDASGTIAKTLTYAKWRGIKYARQRVVPSNPRTTAQTNMRNVFAYLNDLWKFGPDELHAPYFLGAKGRPLTDRNLFQKTNASTAYSSALDSSILASPGTGGAPAPAGLVATGGVNHIGVLLDPGSIPPDWTLIRGAAIAWQVRIPTTQPFFPPVYSDTNPDPALIDITGITQNGTFIVSAYAEFTDAQGRTQYGLAINSSAVVT